MKHDYSITLPKTGIKTLYLALLFWFIPYIANSQSDTNNVSDYLSKIGEDVYLLGNIEINTRTHVLTIPCTVNMTEGLIEVVLCRPEGKVHESLLITQVTPLEFHTAMLLSGFDPVNELPDDPAKADPLSPYKTIETAGDSLKINIEYAEGEKKYVVPIEKFIRDERTKSPLSQGTWLFKGAVTHQSDHVIADNGVTMISTYIDPLALMEINSSSKHNDELFYVNKKAGLRKGQEVKLILSTTEK